MNRFIVCCVLASLSFTSELLILFSFLIRKIQNDVEICGYQKYYTLCYILIYCYI